MKKFAPKISKLFYACPTAAAPSHGLNRLAHFMAASSLATILLALAVPKAPAQDIYTGQSSIFFDNTGTDQSSYGGNEIITISGNLTFHHDCPTNGVNDTFLVAADVYILWHGTGFPISPKLEDIRGSPTVIVST